MFVREVIRNFLPNRKDFSDACPAGCDALAVRKRWKRDSLHHSFIAGARNSWVIETMAKQVTITIETNSLVVLHARGSGRTWCPGCGTAGEVLRLSPRNSQSEAGWETLQRLVTRSDVHYQQAPDGSALICLNSLLAFIDDRLQPRGHGLRAINTKVEEI